MDVVIDLETHLIRPGVATPRAVCVGLKDASGEVILPAWEAETWQVVRGLLEDPQVRIIGQNIAYDMAVICADRPDLTNSVFDAYEAGRVRCTRMRQALIDVAKGEAKWRRAGMRPMPDELDDDDEEADDDEDAPARKAGRDLGELSRIWLGEAIEKGEDTWRLRYGELEGVPVAWWPPEARDYLFKDLRTTGDVFYAQEAWAKAPEGKAWLNPFAGYWTIKRHDPGPTAIPDELRQTMAAFALQLISAWGIRTDRAAVEKLRADLTAARDVAVAALTPVGIFREKWKKNTRGELAPSKNTKLIQQLVVAAYAAQGRVAPQTDPSKKFPDGQVKTDKKTLKKSRDPDLVRLAEAATQMYHLSNYVPTLMTGVDAPICTSFNPLLETGRVSSSKPNLNNPPRKGDVRGCFIPRPGRVFASCDYDTVELRALAQSCLDRIGYSALAEVFRRGGDPHLAMAAELLGIPEAEARVRYDAGDKEVVDTRQFAKIPNFGMPGGLGVDSFVEYAEKYDVQITRDEAAAAKAAWFRTFPEMREFFDEVSILTETNDQIITPMSGRARGGVTFCQFCNQLFQGRVADGAKAALSCVITECYTGRWTVGKRPTTRLLDGRLWPATSPLLGSRVVLFLYDEIVIEAEESRASAAAERLADVMRIVMQGWLPDVPVQCQPVITRRCGKGAKQVRNAAGLIVPGKAVKTEQGERWIEDVMDERRVAA